MPSDFLDTSVLAKHYHPETGSAAIDRLWDDPQHDLFISGLTTVEIMSVFASKVRAGTISLTDYQSLVKRFAADLTKRKRIKGVRVLVSHFQEAARLLKTHGPVRRLRSLDAIQLAVGLDLHRTGRIDRLASSDQDLLTVAALEGLTVLNPENS